jgi:hypothetical protein
MKRNGSRHYTEEELLMHSLREETPEAGQEISIHLRECSECTAVFEEYGELVRRIQAWPLPEIPPEAWQAQKGILLAQYRTDFTGGRRPGFLSSLQKSLSTAWNYALENPLPTLAYIAVAVAFALERTISTFRLDRILPGATEMFQILRQVF